MEAHVFGFEEMATFFDVIAVTCFSALVLGFFQVTDRETGTLMHFVLVGILFASANQLGNNGWTNFALILMGAGTGYAVLVARNSRPGQR
jgi:hypothetical protein